MLKTDDIFLIPLTTLALLTALIGCGTAPVDRSAAQIIEPSSATLPSVAAEFKTTRETVHQLQDRGEQDQRPIIVTWRFWRDADQLTVEMPKLAVGEQWQRDGDAIFHRKLYHNERRAIEFQPDDLRMLQHTLSWQRLSTLLDPQVLDELSAREIDWSEGYPVREYRGTAGRVKWRIVMRLDVALPIAIERQKDGSFERTELLAVYRLNDAPWQPTPVDSYEIIDYADLGDREYDPFVVKVLSQMGHEQHH